MRITPFLAAATLFFAGDAYAQDDDIEKLKKKVSQLETILKELSAKNDELAAKVREVGEENKILREQMNEGEKRLEEKAREVVQLHEMLKQLEAENRRLKEAGQANQGETEEFDNPIGPDNPIKGAVLAVGQDFEIVLLDIGEKEGVRVGYRFDILRAGRTVAIGEVTKFSGTENKHAQLKIIRGEIKDVRAGDEAVARRRIVFHKDGSQTQVQRKGAKITGVIGQDTYAIGAGREQGLKEGDKVYVYRNKKVIGVIRLVWTDRTMAVGKVVDGTRTAEINLNDDVEFEAIGLKKQIIGLVKRANEKEIIVDIGMENGGKPNQLYEVRRKGQKIGNLRLTKIYNVYSYAEPAEGTTRDQIKEGDTVDLIKD